MPTPEHNPQSIPPSEIPPGWRLCRESEREKLPEDARYWEEDKNCWIVSRLQGSIMNDWTWKSFIFITATPLPESEREYKTRGATEIFGVAPSPWIPLSERAPTEQDWGECHGVEIAGPNHRLTLSAARHAPYHDDFTHWRRVELPPLPPAPTKTQREKDEAFIRTILSSSCSGRERSLCLYAAETALAHDRAHFGGRSAAEVKAEIDRILWMIIGGATPYDALRALLSPAKEGE